MSPLAGQFFIDTWRAGIVLVNPIEADALVRYVKRRTGEIIPPPNPEFVGHYIYVPTWFSVIALRHPWDESPQQLATLCHEAGHVTEQILWCRGLRHTRATCEAWQYLHGSIFRRCLECLRERRRLQRKRFLKKSLASKKAM